MKMESQKRQEHILFLATENVILHVNQPYRIRQDMIETKNFIPEAFLMHQFHDSKEISLGAFSQRFGDGSASSVFASYATPSEPASSIPGSDVTTYLSDEDEDDEDWDDEDEEWDDEDEEWDDEDEEWDDEDEDWEDDEDDADGEDDWSDEDEE